MVTILLPQTKRSAPLAEDMCDLFDDGLISIPILGWVACGHPIDMFSDHQQIDVPTRMVRKNTYALRVRGDSMRDANILPGDLVVIEQTDAAEHGEKVVVRINQREVTLKTLCLDPEGVKLIPANAEMAPMTFHNEDIEVLGIVRGVIRDQI